MGMLEGELCPGDPREHPKGHHPTRRRDPVGPRQQLLRARRVPFAGQRQRLHPIEPGPVGRAHHLLAQPLQLAARSHLPLQRGLDAEQSDPHLQVGATELLSHPARHGEGARRLEAGVGEELGLDEHHQLLEGLLGTSGPRGIGQQAPHLGELPSRQLGSCFFHSSHETCPLRWSGLPRLRADGPTSPPAVPRTDLRRELTI